VVPQRDQATELVIALAMAWAEPGVTEIVLPDDEDDEEDEAGDFALAASVLTCAPVPTFSTCVTGLATVDVPSFVLLVSLPFT
jgi:hypothetical protein